MRFLRRLPRSAVKFIVYTAVCLLLLVGLAARIGNLHFFTHRVSYQAELTDATGLRAGDDVKIAGVTVGQVGSVTTRHGLALVSFSVNRGVRLPAATRVGLRWQNVLGLKYLYLYPTGASPYLAAGSTIPASHDESDADIGAFLNALGPILRSIDPTEANAFVAGVLGGLQGNEAKVSALIDNAAAVSKTVGDLNVQIGSVIDNLSAVMSALGARSSDLQQVVSNLATISGSLASRNDVLDSVVENFSKASGEFASLISNNRANLDTAIASLNTIAGTLGQHRQDLDADLTTLTEGLQPYRLISSYGQWFNVQAVYQCLANEASCNYQEGGPKPGSSPAASSSAPSSPAPPAAAQSGPSLSQLLQRVAGGAG